MMTNVMEKFDPNHLSDFIPMGIMMLRSDFVVVFWNKCLEQWTGLAKEQMINQDIRTHFPHFSEPMYSSRLNTIFEGGPPAIFSSQLHKYIIPSKLPTGELRIQHTVVTAVESEEKCSLALFAIQDVTEYSRRMQEYFLLSKALAQSNEELESFTYSVSHDLKAPLRAINGFSSILVKKIQPKLQEDEKQLLDVIRSSAIEMNQLIEDLLSLSRVGRKQLKNDFIYMRDLVDFVVKKLNNSDQSLEKYQISVADDLPDCYGDQGLLKQVYTNIISNAIKFCADSDSPKIDIGHQMIDGKVVYTVEDNGIGFDMKFVDKIFGVFQRLTRSEKYPGTGVGLAIVKRIIEKHNGTVWAESEQGKGMTIFFTIGNRAS